MATGDSGNVPVLDDVDFDDDYFLLPNEAYVYDNKRRSRYSENDSSFKFSPPLYRQRYTRVLEEVRKHIDLVDKVVDFGCAEGKFMFRARNSLCKSIHTLIGVDIDQTVLTTAECELQPNAFDDLYTATDEYSETPVWPCVTYLYQGSIAEYDDRLAGTDVVIAIELIEHLMEDVLEGAVDMIFGRIRPYLVIFTTPNVEFNVLFNMGDRKFRHDDHKFEWTREQFQDWCKDIVARYPKYRVEFSGIGNGPEGTEEKIGHASQMAVFQYKHYNTYCKKKNLRSAEIREKSKDKPRAEPQHMMGEMDKNYCTKQEHPYKLIARIFLPSDIPDKRAYRRAASFCNEYCRDIYYQHYDQCELSKGSDTCADGIIVKDPDTGIKGMWFNVADLFELEFVKKVCTDANGVGSLLFMEDSFIIDGGGFSSAVTRVFYQDEMDLAAYKANLENQDQDEEDYQYDQTTWTDQLESNDLGWPAAVDLTNNGQGNISQSVWPEPVDLTQGAQ